MKLEIPEYVSTLMKKLNQNGYECFVVGGAIRSLLLNKPVNDYDLTTDALPDQTKQIFKEYHTIDTGIQHGTVTVISSHIPVEITTYRKDAEYKDHRHPDEVIFTTTIKDDCARRDFTINAFCYNEQTGILDFFEGKKDLDSKQIQCIGNAYQRFEEDALRILRAIRFASQLNFTIEENTAKAILDKKDTLTYVSTERIQEEFTKYLAGDGFLSLLYPYRKVFSVFLKEFDNIQDEWETLIVRLSNTTNDPWIRLAILLSCTAFKNPKKNLRDLKYSNKEIQLVTEMIHHKDAPLSSKIELKHLLSSLSCDFDRYINYRQAIDQNDYTSVIQMYQQIQKNNECYTLKQLAFNGSDMIALGFKGKEISDNLYGLLNAVIDEKVANTKEELIHYVKMALH